MPKTIQLLKQVRSVTRSIASTTENSTYQNLLSMADMFLNELMLQDASSFYLDYVRDGKSLLDEGRKLATAQGLGLPPAPLGRLRDDLNEESRIEAVEAEIENLFAYLVEVVAVLDEGRSEAEKDYLARVTRWESTLYLRHLEQGPSKPEDTGVCITPEAFEVYLRQRFPEWREVKVTKFLPLAGGISKQTILIETDDSLNGPQALVIRAELPVTLLHIDGSDLAQEFYMIQLMHKLGIPGAEALWLEENSRHLGTRFMVSRKAEGSTVGGSFGATAKPSDGLLQSIMETLFQIHNLKFDVLDPIAQKSHLKEWLPHTTIRDAALHFSTEYMQKMIRRADVKLTPQLQRALHWLERNVPDVDEPPVVVHIDYAYNNILIHNDRVSAVLDWETSILGDPALDIIWTQQNLDADSMQEFLRKYRAGTGREVSEYRLAYARVAKFVWSFITDLNALKSLNEVDSSPLVMGAVVFKYMPLLSANVDELIAAAEKVRDR